MKHKSTLQKLSYLRYIFWPVCFGPKNLGMISNRLSCIFGSSRKSCTVVMLISIENIGQLRV